MGCCAPGRFLAAELDVVPTLPRRSRPACARARRRTGVALLVYTGEGCTPAYREGWANRPTGSLLLEAPTSRRLKVISAFEALVGSGMPFLYFTLPFEDANCIRRESPRPFDDESAPRQQSRAGTGEVVVPVCIDFSPTAVLAFRAT